MTPVLPEKTSPVLASILMFADFIAGIVDLIYPPVCILCRDPIGESCKDEQICRRCRALISRNVPPFCAKCSRPVRNPQDAFCKTCRHADLQYDLAWSACRYDDTMRRLIHLFKYGHKTGLRKIFARLLLEHVDMYHVPVSHHHLMIPTPLHPARQRERGYNQSRLVAEILSRKFDIPLSDNNLCRVRHTCNQARLSQKERWTNIHEAFKIKCPGTVKNKNILIIDDLLTTGSTASEMARVFKKAGAGQVNVLTIAIARHAHQEHKSTGTSRQSSSGLLSVAKHK